MIGARPRPADRTKQARGNGGSEILGRGRNAHLGEGTIVARGDAPAEERIPHRVRAARVKAGSSHRLLDRRPDSLLNSFPQVERPNLMKLSLQVSADEPRDVGIRIEGIPEAAEA